MSVVRGFFTVVLVMVGCATTPAPLPAYEHPRTALLVMDIQQDFTGDAARFPVSRAEVPSMLAAANAVIDRAGEHQVDVIYIRNEFPTSQWFSNWWRNSAAVQGTPGTALDPRLHVVGQDAFAKEEASAFSNPAFEQFLRDRHISELVFAGLYADGCVAATAQAALARGYQVTVLSDALASSSPQTTASTVERFRHAGMRVTTSAAFLQERTISGF